MVADRFSVFDLASRLMDALERVRGGEEIVIERDGEVIATIGPPRADSGATLRDLAIELARLPPLDDEFEADVAAVRANQRPAKTLEWPD